MTSHQPVCPDCGATRLPEARFCSQCGRPLEPATKETVPTGAPRPAAPPPAAVERVGPADGPLIVEGEPTPPQTRARLAALLLIAVLVAAFVGIYFVLTRAPLASGPISPAALEPANVPPVGTVWFGSSYNGRTLALADRGATVRTGATAAMVARLSAPVGAGEALVRVVQGTTTMASNTLNVGAAAAGDVVAWTLAFPVAGQYRVSVVDEARGTVLATGDVTAQ